MAAFSLECSHSSRNGEPISTDDIVMWLFRDYPTVHSHTARSRVIQWLCGPSLEACRLLEHAELVPVTRHGEYGPKARWSATRLGLAALANGKPAARQRIKDRTGL
jgi:hypothetical protein